jgi:hypothetical protein
MSGPCGRVSSQRAFGPGDPYENLGPRRDAVRDLLAGARDRYGMAAVRIYSPILIERDLRRRWPNRPYEQVNGQDRGARR